MNQSFTRTELAAVVFILFLLAPLGGLAIGHSTADSDLAACFNNNRRLIQAWQNFTFNHEGALPTTLFPGATDPKPIAGPNADTNRARLQPWAQGWVDWMNTQWNTNTDVLLSTNYSSLAIYLKGQNVFKCPADKFLSSLQRQLRYPERVRSVAANFTMGIGDGDPDQGIWSPYYYGIKNASEIVNPGPAFAHVFLEEHPDGLNDLAFLSPYGGTNALRWMDFPANYHNGAATFSFADGHVELRRWLGVMRTFPVRFNSGSPSETFQADMRWIHDRTPQKP